MTVPKLAVLVDGLALPDAEARAFWERFSDWMEEHRGDLAGFAAREGFASVHPGVDAGRPVLLVSRTAPQGPYRSVGASGPVGSHAAQPIKDRGGSGDRQKRPRADRSRGGNSKK